MLNQTCALILQNLFEYDFSSCYYEILKSVGWDLSNVDEKNKKSRNLSIGYIQRENPRIAEYLQGTVDKLIDHYIRENHIKEEEIILRQKDSITVTKSLSITNSTLSLDLRGVISKLIIDSERKKWLIIYTGGEVIAKGFLKKTRDMSFLNLFRNLDFSNKINLISGLERIRQKIYSEENINWFLQEDENDSFSIPITDIGFIKINKSAINSISIKDIDREFLWKEYIWPFAESILIHCQT